MSIVKRWQGNWVIVKAWVPFKSSPRPRLLGQEREEAQFRGKEVNNAEQKEGGQKEMLELNKQMQQTGNQWTCAYRSSAKQKKV